MELDELKQAWQTLDRRLESRQALDDWMFLDLRAGRVRRSLRPLLWGQSALIVLGIAIALWGIGFWSTHVGIWQAMACGIAMQVFGTLSIIFPARVFAMARGIDPAAPVVEIQRRIAALRCWRVRVEAPVFAGLGSVIWIPALLMLAQYGMDRTGEDVWAQVDGRWLWSSLLGSPLAVGVAYGLLRRLGLRRVLEDSLAGRTLTRAQAMLEELGRFERE